LKTSSDPFAITPWRESKRIFSLLFSLMKKVTKKSRRKTNRHFLRARRPGKRSEKNYTHAGSSLKMFTEHFLNAQPRTLSPKPAALLPTYDRGASTMLSGFL
jgi:hypothetical protein